MNYKELLETYKAARKQYGFKDPLTKYYANLIICICTGKDHKAVIKNTMTIINQEAREQGLTFYLQNTDLSSLKKDYTEIFNLISDLKIYVIMHIVNNQTISNKIKEISNNNQQTKKLLGEVFKEIVRNETKLGFELEMMYLSILNNISDIEFYEIMNEQLKLT